MQWGGVLHRARLRLVLESVIFDLFEVIAPRLTVVLTVFLLLYIFVRDIAGRFSGHAVLVPEDHRNRTTDAAYPPKFEPPVTLLTHPPRWNSPNTLFELSVHIVHNSDQQA